TPAPGAAAPPGGTGSRSGSSARRVRPASHRPGPTLGVSGHQTVFTCHHKPAGSDGGAPSPAPPRPRSRSAPEAPGGHMRRGGVWWVEFDERRPVVLLSGEDPPGFRAMQVVAPADTDISGWGIEVAVGVQEGLPFEGVLRFAFPHPGFTPCTWLTTL